MPDSDAWSSTNDGPESAGVTWRVIAMAVGALIVLLVLSASSTLWDRDEPRFARAAVEMMRSGDYLVPTFNGELRPDKPVLIYWLMVAGMHVFGVTELGVRFCSSIGIVAAGVLTFAIGRRLFDARIGLWAMAILLTSILTIYIGSAAMTDGVLLALITLAMYVFVEIVQTRMQLRHAAMLSIAMGLALLTKGPVGLAIPVLSILASAWLGRRSFRLGRRLGGRFWWGFAAAVIIAIGMFIAWAIPANARTGGQYLEQGLGRHVLQRMAAPMEGHGGKGILGYVAMIPLYVPFLIAGFWPWTLQLPAALIAMKGGRIGDGASRAVLWGWTIPTFVLMSFVATKLPHYILPIYPALAIACAAMMSAWARGELTDKDRDWLRAGSWFFGAVGIGAALGLIAWAIFGVGMHGPGIAGWRVMLFGVGLLGITIWIVRAQAKEQVIAASKVMLVAVPLLLVLATQTVLPAIERELKISPELAAAIHARVGDDVPIYMTGYREPSLVFYLDRPVGKAVQAIGGSPEAIANWARESGPAVLVVQLDQLKDAERLKGPLHLNGIDVQTVVNYSARGRSMDVVVVGRKLGEPETGRHEPHQ